MNDMVDMSRFIEATSDQLNADDLIGRTLDITITRVTGDGGDQPVAIHYEGDNGKPFKPCKTIRRVLMAVWGKYASKDYPGRSCRLYRDDSVTFGGLATGGIRISHVSHIDKEMMVVVMKSKGKKAGMKILPMPNAPAQEDKAAQWADGFIAKVRTLTDIASIDALTTSQAKTLAKLATERPDLSLLVNDAVGETKESISDPFEGPADEQRGEAHAIDADWIIAKIEKLVRVSDVNGLVESHMDTIMAFPDEDKDRIVAAQMARNDAIKGGE